MEATVADVTKASVYASVDSKRKQTLTIVVVDKDQRGVYQGRLKIAGPRRHARVAAHGFAARTKWLKPFSGATLKGNQLSCELQPLSPTILISSS